MPLQEREQRRAGAGQTQNLSLEQRPPKVKHGAKADYPAQIQNLS